MRVLLQSFYIGSKKKSRIFAKFMNSGDCFLKNKVNSRSGVWNGHANLVFSAVSNADSSTSTKVESSRDPSKRRCPPRLATIVSQRKGSATIIVVTKSELIVRATNHG